MTPQAAVAQNVAPALAGALDRVDAEYARHNRDHRMAEIQWNIDRQRYGGRGYGPPPGYGYGRGYYGPPRGYGYGRGYDPPRGYGYGPGGGDYRRYDGWDD